VRCISGGDKSFGAADDFLATGETGEFDADAIDCASASRSFGWANPLSGTGNCKGYLERCKAGTESFGHGLVGSFTALAVLCVGKGDSFGLTTCTGTLRICFNEDRTVPLPADAGSRFYDSTFSATAGSVFNVINDTPVFRKCTIVALDLSNTITSVAPQQIKADLCSLNVNIAGSVVNLIPGGNNVVSPNVEV
jgi:hypothetical protein